MIGLLLAAVAAAGGSADADITGHWRVAWACVQRTPADVYTERCAQGVRDYFELELWSEGEAVCGAYSATAHLGNRIDEDEDWGPSIVGRNTSDGARLHFHSSSWGGDGHATVRIRQDKLVWHVTDRHGESWVPPDAVLSRQAGHYLPGRPPPCSAVSPPAAQ